jgi:NAD(P)-dependent dehydrogenase (short-subunit alcohol dehydrogenase family)
MKLKSKIAIVTGGGRGIGRGIALCLAEEGADVAIVDLDEAAAAEACGKITALGRKALAVKADLTKIGEVEQAVSRIVKTFGKIDILVNNVGGLGKHRLSRMSYLFSDVSEEEWDENFALNLKSHFLMSKVVAPYFVAQKSGKIVNTSSVAGKGSDAQSPGYGASKAADISLTRTLAMALAPYNVNVNSVCPGSIYTDFQIGLGGQYLKAHPEEKGLSPRDLFDRQVEKWPLRRENTPEDIGRAVVFLVSEDSRNITGQTLNISCGTRFD